MNHLVIQNITKHFAGVPACKNINLSIQEGEFFTFLGPSGCGKTTLLRIIAGFLKPESGSILLGNRDMTALPPEKRQVGMVFQNYALFPFMSVQENIEYGLRIQKRSASEIRKKTGASLEMVGLEGFENRSIAELSGGEQQRVAIARSLVTEPKVLLLDEPLSNLDAKLRDSMRDELKRLQRHLGITTIFVTHDQKEALSISDTIAIFNAGSCIQTGTPEEIYWHPGSVFAAQFIGITNLFSIHQSSTGPCFPDTTPLKTLPPSTSFHSVSIRPQLITLAKKAPLCDYLFQGRIREKQFTGLTTEYTVSTAQDMTFHVLHLHRQNMAEDLHLGDQVHLGFSDSDLLFLP